MTNQGFCKQCGAPVFIKRFDVDDPEYLAIGQDYCLGHYLEQPEVIAYYEQYRKTGKRGYALSFRVGNPARITHKDIVAYWKPKFIYRNDQAGMMRLDNCRTWHFIWLRWYFNIELQTIQPYDALKVDGRRVLFERKKAVFVPFRWLTVIFKAH